jgi:flagellar motor switch protein FliG
MTTKQRNEKLNKWFESANKLQETLQKIADTQEEDIEQDDEPIYVSMFDFEEIRLSDVRVIEYEKTDLWEEDPLPF